MCSQGDPTNVVDGPRLHPAHKSDSLARKRAIANESLPSRARLSSRLADPAPPDRAPNGAQPSTHTPPTPLPHQQASANGVAQSNVHLHNAYYPVSPQTTATSSAPSARAKNWSQARSPPPHVLISTGAKPMAGGTPGVIASPLQPGASLTRPPLKRDLLIIDSRKGDQISGNNVTSGKCCILM